MQKLYVLYDPKCELCIHLKDWLAAQNCWIAVAVMPAGSELAGKMFPDLARIATASDLVVISDEGAVYLNDRAWIMVLYALSDYRDWAARLTHPMLMPLARQAWAALSNNRGLLSRWLYGGSPEAIADELRKISMEPCALPGSGLPAADIRDYLQ